MMRSCPTPHGQSRTLLRASSLVIGAIIGASIGLAAGLPTPRASAQPGEDPTPTPSAPTTRGRGSMVHLPALHALRPGDACGTTIEIQYLGGGVDGSTGNCKDFGAKAVLIAWGEPGFCPPQAAGPVRVFCTGLLRPGIPSSWTIASRTLDPELRSGLVVQFTAARLSEVGIDIDVFSPNHADIGYRAGSGYKPHIGFDDVVADLMCEELFYGTVADSDDSRKFKLAYRDGAKFRGLPQDIAAGPGQLAVSVRRDCFGPAGSGASVQSSYAGLDRDSLGTYDPELGGFIFALPRFDAGADGADTVAHIQNAGLDCAEIELWFRGEAGEAGCNGARLCERFSLAPGETRVASARDCVGSGLRGSAWLRSSQPLAIVADFIGPSIGPRIGPGTLASVTGQAHRAQVPAGDLEPLDPAADPDRHDHRTLFGPLVYKQAQGWNTELRIQNLDQTLPARVGIEFSDAAGGVSAVLHTWICAGGSQAILPAWIRDLPAGWTGSVTVASLPWWTGEGGMARAAGVAGIALLSRSNDSDPDVLTEMAAYNLLPAEGTGGGGWGSEGGGGSPDNPIGAAWLAVPALTRAAAGGPADDRRSSSTLAIVNRVSQPGYTRVAVQFFDPNGPLDMVCLRLESERVASIDLGRWGFLTPGFVGGALVSASFWDHAVQDPVTGLSWNRVDLGAVVVNRAAVDMPGDSSITLEARPPVAVLGPPFGFCDGPRFLPRCGAP